MHKVWAVIRREFVSRVTSKAFVIGTVLGPLLMTLLVALPILLQRGRGPQHIVILDASLNGFGKRLEQVLVAKTRGDRPDGPPWYHVERVRVAGNLARAQDSLVALVDARGDDGIVGVILLTEETLSSDTIQYFGANVGSPGDMSVLNRTLQPAIVLERLVRANVDPGQVLSAIRPIELSARKVSGGKLTMESGEASFALAYAMAMILYIALLTYGMQVLTSVVEEKANRLNEILVSSLRPFQLLLGKILGVGSVGLLQMGIWGGTGFLLSRNKEAIARMLGATPEAAMQLPIPAIEGGVLVVFLIFFLLGFFLYAGAYAAVGSTCSTVQEAQQAGMPVTLLVAVGLILMFRLLGEPSGTMARVLSNVPLFSPFVTPIRHSLSPMPWSELLVSMAITGLGVLAMAWVAGRVYRVGILMHGKRAKLREVWRWVRTD